MGIKKTLSCLLVVAVLLASSSFSVANAEVAEQMIFHHTDQLSGTSIDTDENGNIIEAVDYYPFGEIRIDQKSGAYENKHKFTGKEFDETAALYYYGARYYDPTIGRFISADPADGDLANPQSLNKYSYVVNNPLKYVDPSGMFFKELWDSFLSTLDMSPVTGDISDVYVALTGSTLFTQEHLSQEDIDLTLAMATLPLATGGQMRMAKKTTEMVTEISENTSSRVSRILNEVEYSGNLLMVQPKMKIRFQNGNLSGLYVKDVIRDLRNGKMSPNEVPVKYVNMNGRNIVVNNKSFSAIKSSGVVPVIIEASGEHWAIKLAKKLVKQSKGQVFNKLKFK